MKEEAFLSSPRQKRWLIFFAWFSILCISDLPDILSHAVLGKVPDGLLLGKTIFLVFFLALCLLWKTVRPLWPYATLMLVLYVALNVSAWVGASAWWVELTRTANSSFFFGYLLVYVRDSGIALAVIASMWIIERRRSAFFLVKGQLDAPVEPVRWLGIGAGESWRTFGWIFAVCAAVGVAIPTLLALPISSDVLLRAASLLPAALFFAAINAFNEEMYFRAPLLSTLPNLIGKNQALGISVVWFGLAHYLYGSPGGVIGFLMTGFLAWLMGKAMLETKGLLWPWFIHFLPDVVVFFSYAVGWVQ